VRQDKRIQARARDFVCLRITRMNDVDLSRFAFDYDLTWMAFFLNAEGHVYSRYGGRDAASAEDLLSAEGLLHTMDQVLRLHRARTGLSRPPAGPGPRRADSLPPLAARLQARADACIHCHHVNEALYQERLGKAGGGPDWLWQYPPPENVGLKLDLVRGNEVREVLPGSPAARAGLRPGDRLRRAAGTTVLTAADLRHVLNGLGATARLTLTAERGGTVSGFTLDLPAGWRRWDVSWRKSVKALQALRIGLVGVELLYAEKKALGVPADDLAMRVRLVRSGSPSYQASLREDDVIVAVDGQRGLGADAFRTYFLLHCRPGDAVPVTFRRSGREHKTTVVCP
jgi:hypothetical protein